MNESEIWAYVAGLLDGEGSICIAVNKPKTGVRKSPDHRLQVGITNTNRELIDWLHEMLGGHISDNSHSPSRKNQTPCWAWRIIGHAAQRFLIAALPFLRIKREQARLAIEFQETKKNKHGCRGVPPEVIAKRYWYKAEISKHSLRAKFFQRK